MELRDILFIIVAIILAVIVFNVFVWLLPVIIILIIAYIIYLFLKGPPAIKKVNYFLIFLSNQIK